MSVPKKGERMKNYKKILSAALALTLAVPGVTVPTEVQAAEVQAVESAESARESLVNLALGKKATANGSEVSTLGPENAVDGDTKSKSSRWASQEAAGPHWVAVDLGEKQSIESVRLVWEMRKATSYRIQVSDNGTDYTDAKVIDGRPASLDDVIILDQAVEARYVRLYIDSFTAEDPDGGVTWNTVSIYEMEIYNGVYTKPEAGIDGVRVETPKKGDKKLKVTIPESEDYDITYNGTDYEQIIDDDLTIYEPLVDTTVKVSFKAVNKKDASDYEFKEFEITVPGTYTQEAADNEAPAILPELREWKGSTGNFTVAENTRVIVADEELLETAEVFAADYEDMTGKTMEVVKGTKADAKAGEFYFALTKDTSLGLMEEGYLMEIDEIVDVTSETATGSMWATRTILQALKAADNTTIPKGMTRDYPLYAVRSFILDVARKTFSLDFLSQLVKQLSWYKMNDFQVHLNDNYIFLENYTSTGRDPMTAYSGFRLESDIKAGDTVTLGDDNKEFTYSADLTSTDMFYTKEEFRSFIQEADVYGVTIVPELDTPAHSLALTKVLPELRTGTSGRNNDHLDLKNQYDECYDFVTNIFDEYLEDEDPVFDTEVVHVGCDEYTADGDAFRRFCNDMSDYMKSKGRTPRIWGSLTQIKGSNKVEVPGDGIQMNLWNFGYANMDEMYEDGFDLINCNDGHYYVVPNAGYYYDYLNASIMFNLPINSINNVTIPAGDKQMVGGAFAIWNDMTDEKENGMSEYDIYTRATESMGLFAAKMWGKSDALTMAEAQNISAVMGDAPSTDFGYEAEADENGKIAQYTAEEMKNLPAVNAAVTTVDYKEALKLNGGESYVTTDFETIGLGNDLRVKVKRTSSSTEDQILFESSYGSIKAVQGSTGKVGITRENRDYSFDYELPVNEWVELEIKNEFEVVSLYVNGVLTDVIGDGETVMGRPLTATCMLPVEKIGSETNAFEGYVTDVRLGRSAQYTSTTKLEMTMLIAHSYLAEGHTDEKLSALLDEAAELTAQFAPSAEKAAKLQKDMEAILATAEYKKADYTRVDAYIALVPEDLSAFTAESAAALENVIAGIQRALPAAMQDLVDSYEVSLRNALNALEVKKLDVYYDNTTAGTKATASNYQGGEEPAKALDGDANTTWHCNWNDNTSAHWFQIELAEEQLVDGFYYLPRQSGTNGIATAYEILVSTDGVNYDTVAEGTWAQNASAKEVSFDAVSAKYVRMNFVKAVGDFASAAEIKVHLVPAEKDTTALEALVANVTALEKDKAQFTEETWNALTTELKKAKAVLADDNSTAIEVNEAFAALAKAKASLVLTEKETEQTEDVVRLSGADRYQTGMAVAEELKSVLNVDKFEAVVIATGKNSADALSGSYLAAVKHAPILLTNGKADNVAALHAYIKANVKAGAKVYILGGEGAVPENVEKLNGYDVVRLSGSTRYETNLAILAEAGLAGDDLLVATGKDFADSLSASAAARPILLVRPNTALSDAQKVVAANFKNIYVVGGAGAVAESTAEELAVYGKVKRLSGAGRYETSVAVANEFFANPKTVVLAYGKNFPDGLCGGPLAAALNAPLVLTREGNEGTAAAYAAANELKSGYVLGGTGVIKDATVEKIFEQTKTGEWELPVIPLN